MHSITNTSLSGLVEIHTGELYSWALLKVSDKELAKDLVQDTFLAAVEKYNDFKGESSPRTWLFAILNNKIRDVYRKRMAQTTPVDSEDLFVFFYPDGNWQKERRPVDWRNDSSELLDDVDFQNILQKCLDNLPQKWKACVQSKYLFEKNSHEICQELNISATNLWQIVHRAKLHLRDCIQNKWFREEGR